MLELRWLERRINVDPAYNVGYPPKYPTEKVLQYRLLIDTVRVPRTTEASILPFPFDGAAKQWTPWQDVPTVKDVA